MGFRRTVTSGARMFSCSALYLDIGKQAKDVLSSMEDDVKRVVADSKFVESGTMNDDEDAAETTPLLEPTLEDLDRSIPQVGCEFMASLIRCRNHHRNRFLTEKGELKERVAKLTADTSSSALEASRFKLKGGLQRWSSDRSKVDSDSPVAVSSNVLDSLTVQESDVLNCSRPEYRDGFILLDCRTVSEVTSWGIIEGAKVLPAHELLAAFQATPEDFESAYGFPKPHPDETIVCYCQYGPRSLMAAQILSWLGYTKVLHFRDGYYEWGKQYNLLLRRWMEHDKTSGNELRRLATFRAGLELQREIAPEFNQLPMQEAKAYEVDETRSRGTIRIGDGLRTEAYAAVAALAQSLPLLEGGNGVEETGSGVAHITQFLEQMTGIDSTVEPPSVSFSEIQEASLGHTTAEHVDPLSSK